MNANEKLTLQFGIQVTGRGEVQGTAADFKRVRSEADQSARAIEKLGKDIDKLKRPASSPGLGGPGASNGLIGISPLSTNPKSIEDLRRQVEQTAALDRQLKNLVGRFDQISKIKPPTGFTRFLADTGPLAGALAKQLGALGLGLSAIKAAKFALVDSPITAARADTGRVALDQVARVNAVTPRQVESLTKAIQDLGVTQRVSQQALARITTAPGLSPNSAPALADVARNVSVLNEENTSEALQAIVSAIVGREVEPLRRRGLAINFEREFANLARTKGVPSNQLTEAEKTAAGLNAVLREGAKFAGTYEAALGSVGKQLSTMPRLVENFAVAIGQRMQGPLGLLVRTMSEALRIGEKLFSLKPDERLLEDVQRRANQKPRSPSEVLKTLTSDPVFGPQSLLSGAPEFFSRRSELSLKQDIAGLKPIVSSGVAGVVPPSVTTAGLDKLSQQLEADVEARRQREKDAADKAAREREKQLEAIARQVKAIEEAAALDLQVSPIQRRILAARQKIASLEELRASDSDIAQATAALNRQNLSETQRFLRETKDEQRRQLSGESLFKAPIGTVLAQPEGLRERQRAERLLGFAGARLDPLADPRREVAGQDRLLRLTEARASAEAEIANLRSRDLGSVQRVAEIQLRGAEAAYRIHQDAGRLFEDQQRIRLSTEVEVARLQRESLDRTRNAAEQTFDALVSNGFSGFGDVLRANLLGSLRTITGNLAEELAKGSRSFRIPGTTDKAGNLTALGRILKDTPFGADPAQGATLANTTATQANTVALGALTTSLSASAASIGIGGAVGLPGAEGKGNRTTDTLESVAQNTKETSGNLGKLLQLGSAAGTAFVGVRAGRQQGGLGGALTAGGSVASSIGQALQAFNIIPGAGSLIAGIGGLVAGIGSLFGGGGNQKAKLEQQVQESLQRNRYQAPDSIDRTLSLGGSDVDFNARGKTRTFIVVENRQTLNISALDSRSIMDRGKDIADSLLPQLQKGHPVVAELTEQFQGA